MGLVQKVERVQSFRLIARRRARRERLTLLHSGSGRMETCSPAGYDMHTHLCCELAPAGPFFFFFHGTSPIRLLVLPLREGRIHSLPLREDELSLPKGRRFSQTLKKTSRDHGQVR